MKIKFLILYFLFIFSLFTTCNLASPEYQELSTSWGKVVIGPSKEEARERFGYPASATEEFWYYINPDKFFVYFPPASILSIRLYPESCQIPVGFPLEFKAFANLSDSKIEDITSDVRLSIDEPQKFILEKPGIIIPKNTGEYQIVAKYKGIFSNPIYLTIKASKEIREEQLLSINILPYRPKITLGSRLDFLAFGTFFDPRRNIYSIKEISREVEWFTQQDRRIINEKDGQIYFPSLGKVKIFCKFQNLESDTQEAEVKNIDLPINEELRHIILLPEFIIAPSGNSINFLSFATYGNRVEDVTSKVNWRLKDKETLYMQDKGRFLAKSQGVTEVIAELDNLKSSPAKVIVLGTKDSGRGSFVGPVDLQRTEEEKETSDYKDLAGDIKNDVEKIRKNLAGEGRKLLLIKIIPDYVRIPLGEKKQLSALGVYSNNSEEDLTLLGEWISSDNRIASVSLGAVSTFSTGEVKSYVKFQGVKSAPASVIVEEPKLVSIIISPQNTQLSIEDKLNLKAEGYFSDSSRKDITSLVNWEISNPRILKIEKGEVRPLRFGQTQVFAEYSGIKSLPAVIKVIVTLQWLLKMLFKIISFLFLILVTVFFILYFMTKHKKDKLLSLYNNPREFIISLYENIKAIFNIFGNRVQGVIPPLAYANLIEKRYSMENNLFLRLTVKFEEAKYSKHTLGSEDVNQALNDYNNILKAVCADYNKPSLFFRYCLSLLRRRPLFVHRGALLANPKRNDIMK